MANITLSGEARWAKVHKPDAKYHYYGLELKPDEASLRVLMAAGITTIKASKDGEGYYSFKRRPDANIWVNRVQQKAGAPVVVDAEGKPTKDLIGNGSTVTISVETYPYDNTYGKGVGCRLDAVRIDKLVVFEDKPQAAPGGLRIMF
jgi:hypothetical protein